MFIIERHPSGVVEILSNMDTMVDTESDDDKQTAWLHIVDATECVLLCHHNLGVDINDTGYYDRFTNYLDTLLKWMK